MVLWLRASTLPSHYDRYYSKGKGTNMGVVPI